MDRGQTPQAPVPPVVPQIESTPQPVVAERDRGLEMVIPINRSGWSIAAGYVALFNIPFVFMAPIGLMPTRYQEKPFAGWSWPLLVRGYIQHYRDCSFRGNYCI